MGYLPQDKTAGVRDLARAGWQGAKGLFQGDPQKHVNAVKNYLTDSPGLGSAAGVADFVGDYGAYPTVFAAQGLHSLARNIKPYARMVDRGADFAKPVLDPIKRQVQRYQATPVGQLHSWAARTAAPAFALGQGSELMTGFNPTNPHATRRNIGQEVSGDLAQRFGYQNIDDMQQQLQSGAAIQRKMTGMLDQGYRALSPILSRMGYLPFTAAGLNSRQLSTLKQYATQATGGTFASLSPQEQQQVLNRVYSSLR